MEFVTREREREIGPFFLSTFPPRDLQGSRGEKRERLNERNISLSLSLSLSRGKMILFDVQGRPHAARGLLEEASIQPRQIRSTVFFVPQLFPSSPYFTYVQRVARSLSLSSVPRLVYRVHRISLPVPELSEACRRL